MLHYNKYLKELGFKKSDFLFTTKGHEDDWRYFPDEDGFINAETFSLGATFDMVIYSHLCYFRDNCLIGVPSSFVVKYGDEAFDKWKEIIDIMIEGYKLAILEQDGRFIDSDYIDSLDKDKRKRCISSKNRNKKIKRARRLFAEYSDLLWW